MVLSIVRRNDFMMSEEPVLYDLIEGPEGQLMMRPTDESRQIMVSNIEDRLADHTLVREPGAAERDQERIAELLKGDWESLPVAFARSLAERYANYRR